MPESSRHYQAAAESKSLEVPKARQAKSAQTTMLQRPHEIQWSPAEVTLPWPLPREQSAGAERSNVPDLCFLLLMLTPACSAPVPPAAALIHEWVMSACSTGKSLLEESVTHWNRDKRLCKAECTVAPTKAMPCACAGGRGGPLQDSPRRTQSSHGNCPQVAWDPSEQVLSGTVPRQDSINLTSPEDLSA